MEILALGLLIGIVQAILWIINTIQSNVQSILKRNEPVFAPGKQSMQYLGVYGHAPCFHIPSSAYISDEGKLTALAIDHLWWCRLDTYRSDMTWSLIVPNRASSYAIQMIKRTIPSINIIGSHDGDDFIFIKPLQTLTDFDYMNLLEKTHVLTMEELKILHHPPYGVKPLAI